MSFIDNMKANLAKIQATASTLQPDSGSVEAANSNGTQQTDITVFPENQPNTEEKVNPENLQDFTNIYNEQAEAVSSEQNTPQSPEQQKISDAQHTANTYKEIAGLNQYFLEKLEKQGVFGMVADVWFGNLFNTPNCSNRVREAIDKLNENSTPEEIQAVREMIDAYDRGQNIAVATEGVLLAGVTGGLAAPAAAAAVGATGAAALGVGVAAGGVAGAATNVGAHQLDHATNQVEGDTFSDIDEVINEAATGAVAGMAAPLTGAIGSKVTGAVGDALGLTEKSLILSADGTANIPLSMAANAVANGAGGAAGGTVISGVGYIADTVTDKDKEFTLEGLGESMAIGGGIGGAIGSAVGAVKGYQGAAAFNKALNPYNVTKVTTAEEVGKLADKAIGDKEYRVATAGYSAPPEGYEDSTKEFLSVLDKELGADSTAYVTSPTADKGSIDAITTEVGKGKLFYTTAEDYVEYINPDNFPETINTKTYLKTPKYVLPDASEYSKATAEASNSFLATGGRNATVSDFVNAVEHGNKSVILNNSSISTPAWGVEKGRVENASKYISEQITAFLFGEELPYPEVAGLTREFMEKNSDKLLDLVKIVTTDGTSENIKSAASRAATFFKSSTTGSNIGAVATGGTGGTAQAITSAEANNLLEQAAKNLPTDYAPTLSSVDAQQYLEAFGESAKNIELIQGHTYKFLQAHGAMQLYDNTAGESVIQIVRKLKNPIEDILNYGK